MNKLIQMRRGIKRIVFADSSIGTITRPVTKPGDRPGQGELPTGETVTHKVTCRVGYQSGGVWASKQWEGGLTIDTSPYALAFYNADIKQGDTLEWRSRKFEVGVVTRPEFDGGAVCTQAQLVEVK